MLTRLQKIAELHGSERCTQFFHELLWLIEEEMIVVRARDRISAQILKRKLDRMVKGPQETDYYQTACRMQKTVETQTPLVAEFFMKEKGQGKRLPIR
jgi:hypothetical protein